MANPSAHHQLTLIRPSSSASISLWEAGEATISAGDSSELIPAVRWKHLFIKIERDTLESWHEKGGRGKYGYWNGGGGIGRVVKDTHGKGGWFEKRARFGCLISPIVAHRENVSKAIQSAGKRSLGHIFILWCAVTTTTR